MKEPNPTIKKSLLLFLFVFSFGFVLRAQTEKESNNDFAAANLIPFTGQATGTACPGDPDYFAIVLPRDGALRVNMKVKNTGTSWGSLDVSGFDQRRGSGNLFAITPAYSTSPGTESEANGDAYCRSAGDTVFLAVSTNTQCFTYTLSFSMTGTESVSDAGNNDAFEQAMFFAMGDTARGHIGYWYGAGSQDAVDYHKIVLPQDGRYRVVVEATNTGNGWGSLYLSGYDRRKDAGNLFNATPAYSTFGGTTSLDSLDFYCRSAGDTLYFKVTQSNHCFRYKITYKMISEPSDNDLEPNNTFEQATFFAMGDTAKGHIGYVAGGGVTDAVDMYKIVLPTDGKYRIIMQGTNTGNGWGSLYVSGYDQRKEAGNLFNVTPAYSIYGGSSATDSLDLFCRSAGDTIYFKVTQANHCFNYKITYKLIGLPSDNDVEPNDSFEQAIYFAEKDTARGHIGYVAGGGVADKVDYYKFVVPKNGVVQVYMEGTNTGNGWGSLYVSGYDQRKESGNLFNNTPAYSIYMDQKGSEVATLYGRSGGDTIYLKVTQANHCFNYKLSYKVVPPDVPEDAEPNNTFAEASYFHQVDSVQGHIGYVKGGTADGADHYKSLLPANGTIKVKIKSTNTGSSWGSLYMSLYDSKQGEFLNRAVAYSVAAGAVTVDEFTIACRLADTTYFRITPGGGNFFTYTFSYEVVSPFNGVSDTEPNNSFATATFIAAGDTVKGNIGYSGSGAVDQFDYFKIKAPKRGAISVRIEATNTGTGWGNLYLYGFNQSQVEIFARTPAYSTNSGTVSVDEFNLYCQSSDTLYFRVHQSNHCYSYKLVYTVSLGADTTVHICPGCTTDISKLYNTAPFSSVTYEDMAALGTPIDPTKVKAGAYRLSVINGTNECTRDTAIITVTAGQTIQFDSIPDKVYGDAPFTVKASSSEGLPVTYKVLTGPVTMKGDTVTITGVGAVTIRAEQAGNSSVNYAFADRSFNISKAQATVTLSEKDKVYDGKPGAPAATTNPPSLPVTFTYNGNSEAPVNAGRYDVVATVNSPLYEGQVTDTFLIKKAAQTLTLTPLADRGFTTEPIGVQAAASSGLPVAFSLITTPAGIATINGNAITLSGTGTVVVTATQTGNQNYFSAPAVSDTFEVTKGAQVVNFPAIGDKRIGDTVVLKATASSSGAVSYSIATNPASGVANLKGDTLLLNGTNGTVTITATQPGNDLYNSATAQQTVRVLGRLQTITFDTIPNKLFSDAPFPLKATATSGLPVSFRVVSGPASISGNTLTLTGEGTVVVEAQQGGSGMFDAATPVQRSFVVKRNYPDLMVQNVQSPATQLGPNDAATVTWTIANGGEISSATDWTERIYMQATNGDNRTLLKQVYHSTKDSIAVGKSVARSEAVTIPAWLTIGNEGVFVVEVLPGSAVKEAPGTQANNTGVQSAAWTVKKLLVLQLSSSQLTEGSSDAISATITRTGSLASGLTVNLSARAPARFSMPATVTIPAGQSAFSVTITATNNNIIEGTILDTLQVAASGFVSATAPVSVLDNDKPTLTISGLPQNAMEGQTITFTVATDLKLTQPLQVLLTSGNRNRFPVPASVTIPAGAQSATVQVVLEQDALPEIDEVVSIIAASANHTSANASLTIKDDDIPGLELVLSTATVSETGGAFALKGTLRRTAGSNDLAFTTNLSANRANTLLLPSSVSLAKGENSKTFDIGVIDNTLVDGDRTVVITASMFVSTCSCNAPSTSSGTVTASLNVTDNDGPALTLSASQLTLPEGLADAGKLRITRNTATTNAVKVTLSSSNTSEATVPASVTIPAGQSFVEVSITTINDGVNDGNQQVYFHATAPDFSPGSVWVMVSDQNKPDLLIPTVKLQSNTAQALTIFNYTVTLRNSGFAAAPQGVVVKGYLSKDNVIDASDSLLSTDVTTEVIPAGGERPVVNAVRLPDLPGEWKLLYEVNPDGVLGELVMTNNTANPVSLTIQPDYTVSATVEQPFYLKGVTIPVTGAATRSDGTPAANAKVEVYVLVNGLRRTVSATTDGAGKYTAQFMPLQNEAGHYTVGASYPGLGATAEQDNFDILGVKVNKGAVPQFKVIRNDSLNGTVEVQNLSNTALSNFSLVPVALPGGATIRFDTVAVLEGNKTINLNYHVSGTALSPGNNYQVVNMKAAASEGTIQPLNVYYYCQAPNAYLEASLTSIAVTTTAAAGEKLVQFTVVNKGIGQSGAITVTPPQVAWLQGVTPAELPSLAPGDTAVVVLKFLALPEVPFNYPIKGVVGVASQNGNSFTLPFSFEKVSQSTGTAAITVTNQFTYFSTGAPKVKDAKVVVKNSYTGEVYAEGITGDNGVFTATGLPEGTHRVTVTKEQHLPYNGTLTVNPGKNKEETVFLNYQAITYNWAVVPTAVQDEYQVELEAKFETNVPMPVVTIDMPKKMPALSGNETHAFNVTITNHGLIKANDVKLDLPTDDPEYEFVTNYVPADLLAQQSIQVPVIMRRRKEGSGGRIGLDVGRVSNYLGISDGGAAARTAGTGSCQGFSGVVYWYTCNTTTGLWQKGGALFSYSGRSCDPGPASHYNGIPVDVGGVPTSADGGYNDVPCATCLPGNGIKIPNPFPPPSKEEKKGCKECIDEIKGALGCAGPPSPGDAAKCVAGNIVKGAEWTDYIECIPIKLPPPVACLLALNKVADKCSGIGRTGRMATFPENGRAMGTSPLGAVFDKIAANLKLVETSALLTEAWVKEYFGAMTESDALTRLVSYIQPSVTSADSIRQSRQDSALAAMSGFEITQDAIKAFFTRWNTSVYARSQGVLAPNASYPNIINWTKAKTYADSLVLLQKKAEELGFESVDDMHWKEYKALNEFVEKEQAAVCASVTVQLSQRLTMTREAFEGTLEIFNGHPTDKMDSLTVNIRITDQNGVPANDLFQINTKSLRNLADITGKGAIGSQQTGGVTFTFIPETGAAPTAPKVYNFGGSITYFDPYAQAMVTMPLSPVPLTVNPSPLLVLHYFMQRNILGDDPLTKPAIEPSEPAELGVMVENHGHGSAVNMTISSAQPKIIDNEKGLAIEFKLTGSNLQGQAKKMGVTDINFGTIPALQTRVGQWYFTSSLLGKFVDYDAKVVHSNSFGNPDLSLVKGVKLHELTRSIKVYGTDSDGINDFLVNDVFDNNDVPDAIYYSQGRRVAKVTEALSGSFDKLVAPPTFTNKVTVTPSKVGWNYIKLDDPGKRLYEIESVTRNDGQVIPLDNVWLTFVTLPASQAPKYENKFHLVDTFAAADPVSYTVVWKAKNTDVPKVDTITGAPKEVTATQVTTLKVVFNKAIDPASFTHEDLALTFQGGPNSMNNSVVITQVDSVTFNVDLSSLTTGNGFYTFTVQAANVLDVYGTKGETGKQVSWSQMLTVPVVQAFPGLPDPAVAPSFEKLDVLFNLPLDVATVTAARFRILKDGVVQPGTVSVDSVRTDHKLFYLSGLGAILTQNGTYELEVDLPNIKTKGGVAGIEKQSLMLTVDKGAPELVRLEKNGQGGLDLLHIPHVNITFNKDVVGFNTAALKLTRNGEVLPITFDMLSNTDGKTWKAGSFGMHTYPDGNYTFSVDMTLVKDALGNVGTGLRSVSWTVDRASLITISNLGFTPDRGYNNKDGVTSGQNLNVTFNIDKPANRVTVYQYDLSGQTALATLDNVVAGAVSVPVLLPTAGNTGIRVTASGVQGGEGLAERALFIDPVPLTAAWTLPANQRLPRQIDSVSLSLSDRLLSGGGFMNTLILKRNGAVLPTGALSYTAINDTLYRVNGLQAASVAPGDYELSADLTQLNKYLSGKEGVKTAAVKWTVLSANQAPVARVAADTVATRTGIFSLNATRSYDPDNDALTFQWTAPDSVLLNNASSATPAFMVRAADDGKVFTFLLVVKDGEAFTTSTVNVRVALSPGTNLPVTWLYFKGQPRGADALLNWATVAERNTKAFVVERSLDGNNFSDIGTVAAAGNRNTIAQYSFVDAKALQLPAAAVYYRLRQVDQDGRTAYSTVVMLPVRQPATNAVTVQAYPNPFADQLTVMISNLTATTAADRITLFSADGRVVYQRNLVAAGNSAVPITGLSALPHGLYHLQVTVNGHTYSMKLVHQ